MNKIIEVKMGKYRHFKGSLYELLHIAEHTETGESMAVYRRIGGTYVQDGFVYTRPLDMFLSKVDSKKYPNVEQENRFEYIGSYDYNCKEIYCLHNDGSHVCCYEGKIVKVGDVCPQITLLGDKTKPKVASMAGHNEPNYMEKLIRKMHRD